MMHVYIIYSYVVPEVSVIGRMKDRVSEVIVPA